MRLFAEVRIFESHSDYGEDRDCDANQDDARPIDDETEAHRADAETQHQRKYRGRGHVNWRERSVGLRSLRSLPGHICGDAPRTGASAFHNPPHVAAPNLSNLSAVLHL